MNEKKTDIPTWSLMWLQSSIFFSYDSQLSAAAEITADETGMAYCIFVVSKEDDLDGKKEDWLSSQQGDRHCRSSD